MFKTKCSPIEQKGWRIFSHALCLTTNVLPPENFQRNKRDFIFPIKQEDICDYNPRCFVSSQLMLGNIIINVFLYIIEQTTYSVKKVLFSKIQDDEIYLYKISLQDYSWKKKNLWYQKDIKFTSFNLIRWVKNKSV